MVVAFAQTINVTLILALMVSQQPPYWMKPNKNAHILFYFIFFFSQNLWMEWNLIHRYLICVSVRASECNFVCAFFILFFFLRLGGFFSFKKIFIELVLSFGKTKGRNATHFHCNWFQCKSPVWFCKTNLTRIKLSV